MSSSADFTSAAQAMAAALLAAITAPADAVRLLSVLAQYTPSAPVAGSDVVGTAMTTVSTLCGNFYRRTAVIALARASAAYQPTSATDAIDTMDGVTALLDAEIDVAGDAFDDATFAALKQLRTAVVQDLTSRGATLAPLITVTAPAALPAVVIANRLYADPSRTPQLIGQVAPIQPLFMPTSFKALAN